MLACIADLHRALERDELLPCFQPEVELRTGRLSGFEVLARWDHAELGLILPSNFISLAEDNGLVAELTRQLFEKAFLLAGRMPAPLALSVNVSPLQLRDLGLSRLIRDVAESSHFPLKCLTIEITESAILDSLETAGKITHELKEMGCRLSLDDFGTGYSSLRHLQLLPFDEIKIDRSFVSGMTKTRGSRKIVASVIGLAHTLGLSTVGEGIETEEQADMLFFMGCQLGQGWLYGRAEPANSIAGFVAALPKPALTKTWAVEDGLGLSSLEALPSQRLAQLQAIYDGAPVGLCFLDKNLRYVSINRRLADLNGLPASAFLGRTVQEVIPHLYAGYEPYLTRALKGEALSGVEVIRPASTPGEVDRVSLATYQPAWDEVGEVIGVSVAVLDVTERDEVRRSATPELHSIEKSPKQQSAKSSLKIA